MHAALESLRHIRNHSGPRLTQGLSDDVLERFLESDDDLAQALAAAAHDHAALRAQFPDLIDGPEAQAIQAVQAGYVNFYADAAINPYLAMTARGPWVVTSHGGVLHDSGGYGMLGFGHAPSDVLDSMAAPRAMANIMTPSFSQLRLVQALRSELGHTRATGCPFDRFVCMNSGSESVTVTSRIADVLAKKHTDPGGRYAGQRRVYVCIERAFHGRTDKPAHFSHSTRPTYTKNLASFRGLDDLWTVPANDVTALRETFARATRESVYIEAMYIEPVQGEGAPGQALGRAFYDEARRLTLEHDTLLVIDSIQAGLRAWGVLSLMDYPGFEDATPPDMETWSKALNGGQYPLSVVGLTQRAADIYARGIYGNTMTTNPRALEIACTVLARLNADLRRNIVEQGERFVSDLRALQSEFPHLITEVQGTGLLFCAELDPSKVQSIGPGSAEERCRLRGIGVIHGGRNALRFTPHFNINDAERNLVVGVLRSVLTEIDLELQAAAK